MLMDAGELRCAMLNTLRRSMPTIAVNSDVGDESTQNMRIRPIGKAPVSRAKKSSRTLITDRDHESDTAFP